MRTSDLLFVQATVDLAENGRFTCAPNPTVGCIITLNGQVVGRGYHQYAGQGRRGDPAAREPRAHVSRWAPSTAGVHGGLARQWRGRGDPGGGSGLHGAQARGSRGDRPGRF